MDFENIKTSSVPMTDDHITILKKSLKDFSLRYALFYYVLIFIVAVGFFSCLGLVIEGIFSIEGIISLFPVAGLIVGIYGAFKFFRKRSHTQKTILKELFEKKVIQTTYDCTKALAINMKDLKGIKIYAVKIGESQVLSISNNRPCSVIKIFKSPLTNTYLETIYEGSPLEGIPEITLQSGYDHWFTELEDNHIYTVNFDALKAELEVFKSS